MLFNIVKKIKHSVSTLQTVINNNRGIERKVDELEIKIQNLSQRYNKENDQSPPIIIEQLYVEKIMLDKVEYNNNLDSLGIKDLSGMLNIGANYGLSTAKNEKEHEQKHLSFEPDTLKQTKNKTKDNVKKPSNAPKYTMHFRETKLSK